MLSVGIDTRPLIFTAAGIRTYVYNLVVSLARIGNCRLGLFVPSSSRIDWKVFSENISEQVIRLPRINSWCDNFWQEYMLPSAMAKKGIEVFHGPRFFVPKKQVCPSVVTIHDLAFNKLPGMVLPKTARYFDAMVSYSAKASRRIIVPSMTTAEDLQRLYKVPAEKISVVHEAADPEFCPGGNTEDLEELKLKLGIKAKFILSVGTIEPRKNYSRLLKAFNILIKDLPDLQLVIAGGFGWLYEDIFKTVEELKLKDKVIFTAHFLNKGQICCLYRGCEAFVAASLYEGFGLPVLEALQSGCCVVAADNSSLKELFGECSYLVEAQSEDSIASGLKRVITDGFLRGQLKGKGLSRARDFSWDKAARETLSVYNLCYE